MERTESAKLKRRITPASVCQAIHDVPYHMAHGIQRAVRDTGRCLVWTWDAIAADARRTWRSLCTCRLVTGTRALLRAPVLVGFHRAFRENALVRLTAMISVTALLFVAAAVLEPVRTLDAICIVVDDDGPHVVDDKTETASYGGLLLQRSLGNGDMQFLLEPGRTITVTHGGVTGSYTTEAERLAAFLTRCGIRLEPEEMVELNVSGDVPTLRISDTLTYQHYVTVATDYDVIRISDPLMDKGTEEVIRKGVSGVIVETYEDTVIGGEVVSTRYVGASHDTSHAELVVYGTRVYEVEDGDTIEADFPYEDGEGGYLLFASGDTMTYSKVMTCSSTAYYSGGDGAGWTTAVGATVGAGTVAVDPTVIPYYTKMFIQTVSGGRVYGMGTALDCGGAIKGNIIDLWFPTRAECVNWGRRNVTVYILDKKS